MGLVQESTRDNPSRFFSEKWQNVVIWLHLPYHVASKAPFRAARGCNFWREPLAPTFLKGCLEFHQTRSIKMKLYKSLMPKSAILTYIFFYFETIDRKINFSLHILYFKLVISGLTKIKNSDISPLNEIRVKKTNIEVLDRYRTRFLWF